MTLGPLTSADLVAFLGGVLVAALLAVFGGGGSVLATPILAYAAGAEPHVAVGTSALAVSLNALAGLVARARAGMVKWRCAGVFAAAGVLGAAAGAFIGQRIDGQALLALFGLLMLAVAGLMLARASDEGDPAMELTSANLARYAPRLAGGGFAVGGLSGFFGIGGGFLIAPALAWGARLPLAYAAASSLVAVAAFGATTAVSYAAAGLIDARLAAGFIAGGVVGAILGSRLADTIAARRGLLPRLFAGLIAAVGVYVVVRGLAAL